MKTVPLHGRVAAGRVALIDDQDYDLVMPFRWFVSEVERRNRAHGPYVVANAMRDGGIKSSIKMHGLITGWPLVDHDDHDGLNNQRFNLRPATALQNQQNSRSRLNSTSRFKGVSWNAARRTWMAQIAINGKNRYLGLFADESLAARAYDAEAYRAFGTFAVLNFPAEYPAVVLGEIPALTPNRDGWVPFAMPARPACKMCGGPLRVVSRTGICTRTLTCARENKRRRVAGLGAA